MTSLICAVLGACDILLIVVCALIVAGVVISAIVRKANNKTSCGGDCGCCSGCSHCAATKVDDKNKTV